MELFYGKYQKERLLGRGAFSEVWQVTDVQTGVTQALKIYSPMASMDGDGVEMMKHEFALMANANHQNLLRPLYFDICNNQPFLVLSYCKNGNIKNYTGKFTEHDAWKLLKDCASGLAYLHTMRPPVIHQDIKPDNILIADNGSYMLTDFGVSIKAKATMSRMTNGEKQLQSAGTLPYMSPERFSKDNRPIMAGDIWSLGVTVYEMLSGYLPFCQGEVQGGLLQKMGAEVPDLQGYYSQALKDVLARCMSATPWERPTAEELESLAAEGLKGSQTLQMTRHDIQSERIKELGDTTLSRETAKSWKKYVLPAAIIVALLAGLFFLFMPSFGDEAKAESTQPAVVEEDPMAVTQGDAQEATPLSEAEEAAREVVTKPVEQEVKAVQKPAGQEAFKENPTQEKAKPIKTNLSYGNWTGDISNGRPSGIGTLTFIAGVNIRCSNGSIIQPQAGDCLEDAEFDDDGYLYQGRWLKSNGLTKTIMP